MLRKIWKIELQKLCQLILITKLIKKFNYLKNI